jgi:hypothetical protein
MSVPVFQQVLERVPTLAAERVPAGIPPLQFGIYDAQRWSVFSISFSTFAKQNCRLAILYGFRCHTPTGTISPAILPAT